MNLREQLQAYMRQRPYWIASGVLQGLVLTNPKDGTFFTPQTIGRTMRSMEERKLLAVKYVGNKNAATYKHVPEYLRRYYIPVSQREGVAIFSIPTSQVQQMISKYTHYASK